MSAGGVASTKSHEFFSAGAATMTQPRSDVVLFNFVYGGPKPYLAP